MIPYEIVDTINDLHIEDVVQKWGVSLKKTGASYKACCPLHGEKTPSFSINTAKNIFKCFGCGEGGGPVAFVMKHDKVEWLEAIKRLADAYKIALPQVETTPKEAEENKKREAMIVANEIAFKYFQQAYANSAEASLYAKSRWSEESIKLFGIGYAPEEWQGLHDFAKKNGVKTEILKEVGLLSESKGRLYDYFRGRLIFPIYNKYGRIIAFTGRLLTEQKEQPKYLNSPETDIYQKGWILYGMFQSRTEISREEFAYLVEGNPDVIRMHQIGAGNTVAVMGSGLTDGNCVELKRLCKTVTIVTETDKPGLKAVVRNATVLLRNGFSVMVLELPEEFDDSGNLIKQDADSFFKTKEQFAEHRKLKTADFIMWHADRILDTSTPERKQKAIKEVAELISLTGDSKTREYYLHNISQVHKPKKMWKDAVDEFLKEYSPEEVSKLPKNVNSAEFEKYGFYAERNCLIFSGKYGISRGSNFTLEPLFHVVSVMNSKRIFKIINEFGHQEIIELKQEDLIALAKFKLRVESLGNFIWEGGESELMKYKRFIYEKTETCYEITQLGWQKDGFWAWGNGIFAADKFTVTSSYGIVKIGAKNYYLPATSKIFETEMSLFQFERKFVHLNGTISFQDYSRHFIKVFGDNAKLGLCFVMATLFRDIIFRITKFFPILNLFGPKGAGKSAMAHSLMAFFVVKNTPPNINNATIPALAEVVSQACNACTHIDEYKNSTDFEKIEFLKGLWDGAGRTRMNMDRDKKRETTSVDAGVILSGQEMPTADIALFSRLVFLTFTQTTYSEKEVQDFNKLRTIEELGLSHITNSILSLREKMIEGFYPAWNQVTEDINKILDGAKVEERVYKNWSVVAATYACLQPYLSLPFTTKEIVALAAEGLVRQSNETKRSNELSTFWSIMEYLVQDGQIFNEADFRVEHLNVLKTDKIDAQFGETKAVLFINHTRIFQLYRKNGKIASDKVLPINTLQYYLQNSKEYLGMKKSMAFKVMDIQQRNFSEETVKDSEGFVSKKRRLNVTTAYAFDYDALGININYTLEGDSGPIVPVEEKDYSEGVQEPNPQRDLPF